MLFRSTPPTTVAGPKTLSVALSENPFRCDGIKRVFGRVSGAIAGETVSLSESYNGPLVSGVADANGEFSVRWSCPPSSAGATWTITATGNSSGRTVRFSFTGA